MYKALYREYRPEIFRQVLGQEHVVRILKNQIETGTVGHAYLFCGTRGTGKTTLARILAKGLNCLEEDEKGRPCGKCPNCEAIKEGTFLDVIEIDAASNNGVENVRELRESVKYPPAVGRRKIYIIDEVHMLTTGAANALLKTLEEPPEYVTFILATTDPQKLADTILSRCMRLDFQRISEKTLVQGLKEICVKRDVEVSEEALHIVAANADGSVRDALSILEQCMAFGKNHIEKEDIDEFLGLAGLKTLLEFTDAVRRGKTDEALMLLNSVVSAGKDVRQFMRDWLTHYRNLMLVRFMKNPEEVLCVSTENCQKLREQSETLEMADINKAIISLSNVIADAKYSSQPRILLEVCLVQMTSAVFREFPREASKGEGAKTDLEGKPAGKNKKAEHEPKKEDTGGNRDKGKAGAKDKGKSDDVSDIAEEPEDCQENVDRESYEELWCNVLDLIERENRLAKASCSEAQLKQVDEGNFLIEVDSDTIKKVIESNRGLIEEVMKKVTGTSLCLKCEVRNNKDLSEISREDEENLKKNVEIIFGSETEDEA